VRAISYPPFDPAAITRTQLPISLLAFPLQIKMRVKAFLNSVISSIASITSERVFNLDLQSLNNIHQGADVYSIMAF
jgi:hypothetical protein